MGVIRVKVREYADVVNRILGAIGKSERLTIWHKNSSLQYPLYSIYYSAKDAGAALIYISRYTR